MPVPHSAPALFRWICIVILALAPVWVVGTLDRGLWTPDEPREADIVWRMSQQADRTLPELAGTPFLEKPPLSYWMSAGALHLFGDSSASARSPNVLYSVLGAIATGALAFMMANSAAAAVVAALIAGTAITAFRVTSWLAPDACLLAGCAIALLGVYAGYTAPPGRRKLRGYLLMHLGAAIGFMAKSAPGWLVPALALITLIAWERRWSELRRWELYVGFLLQALIIGPWIYAVTRTAHGTDALLALFWHNIVGRFTKVDAPVALAYSTGHRNSPGKYFLELPVYLLPWTLLAVAAVCRSWQRVRAAGPAGTPWRFAIAAILPFLVLLSVASTARDIYAAPALLGFGVLIALWLDQARQAPTRLDAIAMRGTRILVAVIAALFAVIIVVITSSAHSVAYPVIAAVVVAFALTSLRNSALAQRHTQWLRSFGWTYTAYAVSLCVTAICIFPVIDRWQNLALLAQRINADTRDNELALLAPDETTVAVLDHRLSTRFTILTTDEDTPEHVVSQWLNSRGRQARVLVLLPGRAPGELTHVVERFRPSRPLDDGKAGQLASQGIASIVQRYELPHGRRYALLGPR